MAFFKGSTYEFTPVFEPNDAGEEVFRGLRARRLRKPEAVLEHTVALKNRLDGIAHEYFAQSRDWRWLAEANPDALFPEDLIWDADEITIPENGRERTGRTILIPRRRETS